MVFEDQLWVIAGATWADGALNDVYASSNGITWSTKPNGGFTPRTGHAAVVFDNKIWVIGGFGAGSQGAQKDVWSSSDGETWQLEDSNPAFPLNYYYKAVVYDDGGGLTMWLFPNENSSEVWKYNTGTGNWDPITYSAGYGARSQFAVEVFNGQMWVIGGNTAPLFEQQNDVWSSADGITWTPVTLNAPFSARYGHSLQTYGGKLHLVAGYNNADGLLKDVWCMDTNNVWTQATAAADFSARSSFPTASFLNRLWVIGGDYFNPDVWESAYCP